jgi:stage II sporulation protein AA (anti-sigma F factor antagonist)
VPGPVARAQRDAVLVVSGELDMATAGELSTRLERAIAGHASVVVVDTSAVSFVDCSGLRPLLAAEERLGRHGRQLRLVSPSAPVLRLLHWAGAEEAFGLPAPP